MAGGIDKRIGKITAEKTGDWKKAQRDLLKIRRTFKLSVARAIKQESLFYVARIKEGFRKQEAGGKKFKELEDSTLAARRAKGIASKKALVVHGDLRNSISSVHRKLGAWVGVKRTAKGKEGSSTYNLALIHEKGAKIKNGFGKGILITIPARPFIMPVFQQYGGKKGAERLQARIIKNMGGKLGKATKIPHTKL